MCAIINFFLNFPEAWTTIDFVILKESIVKIYLPRGDCYLHIASAFY